MTLAPAEPTVESMGTPISVSPEQLADQQAAWTYIDTLPTALRGRELAEETVFIVEKFPNYHNQGFVCDRSRACLVGWVATLAMEPVIALDFHAAAADQPSLRKVLTAVGTNGLEFPDPDVAYNQLGFDPNRLDPDYAGEGYEVKLAADLLGIPDDEGRLSQFVFCEMDKPTAIHNFKVLTGLIDAELEKSTNSCSCYFCQAS